MAYKHRLDLTMGMPKGMNRMDQFPLDMSSVYYDYATMENYAKTSAIAYVGQPLSLVDEENGIVTLYTIQDTAGTLEKVGTTPIGDESTITVAEDGTVSLYGVEGLTFTEEVAGEEEGTTVTKDITYQPLLVKGKLTWVVPSATTVEGLAAEIEGLKTRIGTLETTVGDAESGLVKDVADNASNITTLSGRLDDVEADLEDVYTKDNVYTKTETDNKIGEMIDTVSHLKTQVVTSEAEMTKTAVLYLVKDDSVLGVDKYKEYIVMEVDGENKPVCIGDTTTNLEGYVTDEELKTKTDVIDQSIEDINDELDQKALASDLTALQTTVGENKSAVDASILALQEKDTTIEGRVKTLEDVGSEKNVIAAVSSEFEVTEDTRTLSVKAIEQGKVTGLAEALAGKVNVTEGYGLISAEDQEKLNKLTITDGNLEISGSVEAGSVKNLNTWITGNRDSLAGLFSTTAATKLDGIADGAQVNVIEKIQVAGTEVSVTDKTVNLGFATADLAGVIKSAVDVEGKAVENAVYVDSTTGIGTVKKINVNSLTQSEGDTLILHGGSASTGESAAAAS